MAFEGEVGPGCGEGGEGSCPHVKTKPLSVPKFVKSERELDGTGSDAAFSPASPLRWVEVTQSTEEKTWF